MGSQSLKWGDNGEPSLRAGYNGVTSARCGVDVSFEIARKGTDGNGAEVLAPCHSLLLRPIG